MTKAPTPARRLANVPADAIPFGDLFAAQEPVVMEGLASNWPLVEQGRKSPGAAVRYLTQFGSGQAVTVFHSPEGEGGRLHYGPGGRGMNFTAGRADFADTLAAMIANVDGDVRYIGSTDIDRFLPGLRQANDLPLDHPDFAHRPPLASIWIGNGTIVPAHYDISNNLACCMVGHRRFTLFPPDQVANLYPGPLDPTPAGQVVSMVDFRAPDLDAFPRFEQALENAIVAELAPGDVLFYPALWWHQVEALDAFNVMINYWWNAVPAHIDTPETTLLHALLSLRDRPEHEKRGWAALFDYYVFGKAERAGAHLPEDARGPLGPMTDLEARKLRARLLHRLNR
ncbi:cupin-like domain-containing protein [Alteriqipengyuania sp. 357]